MLRSIESEHSMSPINHYDRSALNYFAANPVDRMTVKRRDEDWLAAQLVASTTRIVPVQNGQSLIAHGEPTQAALLSPGDATQLLKATTPILLGTMEGTVYFAVDVPQENAELQTALEPYGTFRELRSVYSHVDWFTSAMLAYAKGMVYWHQRHRYCGDCGSPSRSAEGGFMRVCASPTCEAKHFPRTDPAIIVLIYSGDRCLLGRQPTWPPGRYSIIAGFVEPGESAEDAVMREAMEEAGVRVTNVEYQASQPWPFPSSLMLGYMAEAISTEVDLIDEELEAAHWFTRAQLADMVRNGKLKLPPDISISHRLIERWFDAGDQGTLAELVQGPAW